MKFIGGSVTVTTADTELPLSTHASIQAADRILWAVFQSKAANTGIAYVGVNGMNAVDGWELAAAGAKTPEIPFRELGGSVSADSIYFNVATNGDIVDFLVILE